MIQELSTQYNLLYFTHEQLSCDTLYVNQCQQQLRSDIITNITLSNITLTFIFT